jgi:hypothetical protein
VGTLVGAFCSQRARGHDAEPGAGVCDAGVCGDGGRRGGTTSGSVGDNEWCGVAYDPALCRYVARRCGASNADCVARV